MSNIVYLLFKYFRNSSSNYKFSISNYESSIWIKIRSVQFIRGKLFYYRYSNLFIGSGCKIYFTKYLNIGRSCIIGDNVSINAFSLNGIQIGNSTTIEKGSILVGSGVIRNKGVGIVIGSNCSIGSYSYLGGQGGVNIGNDTLIGPYFKVFSENHNFHNGSLIRLQGETRRSVHIGNNCWIGANTTFLAGSEIGDNCVVAASSLVNKKFPSDVLIAGVPARIIRSLSDNK
jgi:acetyltransferase-like isoleucine patch superfamily enzyme